ncbi:GGDEF domain-containing protein [Pseudoroseomonas cervicalis]|uniref:diguanylate cyclase n=1 Tax=Pseudoroseomonas cervicalis ATCC 49957 TaxID=525371 RepID=D5RKT2_9PROT|nr:GGDEF domain-containing protein [Pseudoroseomonas cervicalis]EFH12089.1 diguanylate cyclase (GGDEF) domain protein [Pseudoroseomonas cervicalis ATCC 49957]
MRELFRRIAAPQLRDRAGLARYVATATGAAVLLALAVDVAQQLLFFTDWPTALRSWAVTIVIATGIGVLLLGWIGRAHLALYEAKQQAERLSRTDPLTGLANRRALLEAAERGDLALMALVIIDLDHFKRVNDTHGHRVGDAVLQAVSGILAAELGEEGVLARLGGEEFALLAPGEAPAALLARLVRLRDRLADQPVVAEGRAVSVTISAGVALRQAGSFDALYGEADRALYAAKQGGRNRICLSEPLRHLCPDLPQRRGAA